MAQKVSLIDDLDGSEADETVTYSLDDQEYEIDLSEENAAKFRETLEPYIDKSRPVGRRPPAQRPPSPRPGDGGGSGRGHLLQIRARTERFQPDRTGGRHHDLETR